jgi:hypothetical protein
MNIKCEFTLFPVKENMGKGTGMGTLIPIYPASISVWNFLPWAPLLVKIEAPFPHWFLFINAIPVVYY